MKKKLLAIALSVAATIGCVAGLAGCSGGDKILDADLPEYEYEYNAAFEDPHDEDMVIDGVLDEARWSGKKYLEYEEGPVKLKYTTAFSDYGVYIGGVAYDKDINYYGRFDMLNNSGFTIWVSRSENNVNLKTEKLRLEVDAKDRRSYYQHKFAGATQTVGELNSNNTESMTMEMFVSWNMLGYDVGEEGKIVGDIPETVKIEPVYRYVVKEQDDYTRVNYYPTFTEPDFLKSYHFFGGDGLADDFLGDETVGDAANGLAKTRGWVQSEDGALTTEGTSVAQVIYFNGVEGNNLQISATVKLDSTENKKFGLIFQKDFSKFRAIYINNEQLMKNDNLQVSALTYYNATTQKNRTFTENQMVKIYQAGYKNSGELHIELIKSGKNVLFFVEGQLVCSEQVDWFDMDFCPGLYAIDGKVTFTDYSAKALTKEEVTQTLSDRGIYWVETPGSVTGAKMSVDTYVAKQGGTVQVELKPSQKYVLTDFLVNGESIYADVQKNLHNDVYTYHIPEDADCDVLLEPVYSKVENEKDNKLKLSGETVTVDPETSETAKIANASIRVQALDADGNPVNWFYFNDESGTKGAYTLSYLPVAGTVIPCVDGDYTVSGQYRITVEAAGYRKVVHDITVYGGERGVEANGEPLAEETFDIPMEPRVIGGSVSSGSNSDSVFNFVSKSTGWDLDGEKDGTLVARYGSSGIPQYFTGVVSDCAIIDFTIQNNTDASSVSTDKQPSAGFAIANGNYALGVVVVGKSIRVLPNYDWNSSWTVPFSSVDFNTGSSDVIGVRAIRKDQTVAVLISPKNDGNYSLAYASGSFYDLGDDASAYGLYTRGGDYDLKFTNCKITTDADAVNEVIDQYLKHEFRYEEPENVAELSVKYGNGIEVANGDSLLSGTWVTVNLTCEEGYFVYAVKNGDSWLSPEYSADGKTATCSYTFNRGSKLSFDIRPVEQRGAAIGLTLADRDHGPCKVTEIPATTTKEISGLMYLTLPTVSDDSYEGNMNIVMTPTVTDFSNFRYVDVEICEGTSKERFNLVLADAAGHAYRIGGKSTKEQAQRIVNGQPTGTRSANGAFQGVDASGGAIATYRFDLKAAMNAYANMSTFVTGSKTPAEGALDLANILLVDVRTYAFKSNKWNFTILGIYGVDAAGNRTQVFDGATANVVETKNNSAKGSVNDLKGTANSAMLYYDSATANKTNYQILDVVTDHTVRLSTGSGTGKWVAAYSGTSSTPSDADRLVWQVLKTNTQEKYLNLSFHDGFSFKLDTTLSNVDIGDWLNAEVMFKIGANGADCRPSKLYAISEDGTVRILDSTVCGNHCKLPTNFKGTIVALFEDMQSNNSMTGKEYCVQSEMRLITDAHAADGYTYGLTDFQIISNAKELVEGAQTTEG